MPFTDRSDLFGAIHEEGINRFIRHVQTQRPSLFNYGTALFATHPELLCVGIHPHEDVVNRGNPLITIEDPLCIPGTDGSIGLNWCIQFDEFVIDFHPGNLFELPPELLPPLSEQHLALKLRICGGVACPSDRGEVPEFTDPPSSGYGVVKSASGHAQQRLARRPGSSDVRWQAPETRWVQPTMASGQMEASGLRSVSPSQAEPHEHPPDAIPGGRLNCFCMDLFATATIEAEGPDEAKELSIELDRIEIVEVYPEGLEGSLECLIDILLRAAILPRLNFTAEKVILELGDYIKGLVSTSVSVVLAPISSDIPYNPAVEADQVKVFLNVRVQ